MNKLSYYFTLPYSKTFNSSALSAYKNLHSAGVLLTSISTLIVTNKLYITITSSYHKHSSKPVTDIISDVTPPKCIYFDFIYKFFNSLYAAICTFVINFEPV